MEFINLISEILKNNKNLKIFLDMDGTIVENIFDIEKSYEKKGKYLRKRPIQPIIEQINRIREKYEEIEIYILSCSSSNEMVKEKDEWLDIYMPNIKKENRKFIVKENGEYTNENIHKVKSEYIKNSISNNEVAVLIDDDNRTLSESLKILGNNVIPIHVTFLLI